MQAELDLVADGLHDFRVPMPEQQRSVPHHVVDQLMAVDVPLVRTGRPLDGQRERLHVAHVVIDGQIDTPQVTAKLVDRDPKTFLDPAAIAETYWNLSSQDASAWTHEIDLRAFSDRAWWNH